MFYVIAYVILAVLASHFNLAASAFLARLLIYICTLRMLGRRFLLHHKSVDGLVKSLQGRHSRRSGIDFPRFPRSRE